MTRGIVEQGKVVNVGVNSFKDPANSSGLYIIYPLLVFTRHIALIVVGSNRYVRVFMSI